ncbi:MAG: hypothetical protein ACP5D2_04970, partial [Candidatus Nanoarchaeia archaeon]
MKKWLLLLVFVILISLSSVFYFLQDGDGFEVDSILIKTSIKENTSIQRSVNLVNMGEEKQFNIAVKGVEDFVEINEDSFILKNNEEKTIILNLSSQEEGVYTGELVISANDKKTIPIIIEQESDIVFFDGNIESLFGEVEPGASINPNIKIYDLTERGTSEVNIHYYIKDFDGNTLISEQEDVV